jgi:endo-1,4-beta-xylanase
MGHDAGGAGTGGSATGGRGGTGGAGGGGSGGSGGTPGSGPTLKAAAAATNRLFGTAIAAQRLSDATYSSTARNEFSYVTAENEMKWDTVQRTRGTFNYRPGDQVVSFAMQNGMKVKGHTLVWHSQLPAWVAGIATAAELRTVMIDHITKVMTYYRGKVAAWDVVNEAWNDDGASLRSSVFMQQLGAGFIDEAFQAARAADPAAKLYYNDYGAEGNSAKANSVYTMVQSMKNRGVPIDGVGLQFHVGIANNAPTIAQLNANMARLAALGLDVIISELDVSNCDNDNDAQRMRYHDIVAACVNQPRCTAITVWGVTDRYSWLNGRDCATPHGLLFDDNYGKKPAYMGVLDALNGR